MLDFFSFFKKKNDPAASGSVAKDRLKLVLVHDRVNCSSQVLEMLKTDIIKEYLRTSRYYHETSLLVDSSAWVFSTLKWKIISKLKIPKPVKKIGKTIINKAKS